MGVPCSCLYVCFYSNPITISLITQLMYGTCLVTNPPNTPILLPPNQSFQPSYYHYHSHDSLTWAANQSSFLIHPFSCLLTNQSSLLLHPFSYRLTSNHSLSPNNQSQMALFLITILLSLSVFWMIHPPSFFFFVSGDLQ